MGDVYSRLSEFLNDYKPVNFSVEYGAGGTYVSMSRQYRDRCTLEHCEDHWGNYFDTPEEGLNACMDMLIRLEFNRNTKHLRVIK